MEKSPKGSRKKSRKGQKWIVLGVSETYLHDKCSRCKASDATSVFSFMTFSSFIPYLPKRKLNNTIYISYVFIHRIKSKNLMMMYVMSHKLINMCLFNKVKRKKIFLLTHGVAPLKV